VFSCERKSSAGSTCRPRQHRHSRKGSKSRRAPFGTTSNEGTCDEKDTPPRPCYEKKFQVALSDKTTHGWRDLEARVTGRDLDDKGKLVDVNRVDQYRYDGKKYQPVKL